MPRYFNFEGQEPTSMKNDGQPVVSLRNISKRFELAAAHPSSLLESLIGRFRKRAESKQSERELWAVRDVSFDVMPGQSLGIVGRNGSGKSTLLKLMTRILRPTEGRMMVRGRVSALLELGAGFHPDLTGRENIFLNAAVLGLKEEDVVQHYDSIVAFSELGEFIDMPVKHYSSGMYMRLGFSVAIHVDPDILIVDEILAVGDQSFQIKCIDQINNLKRKGVTIIMISHNLDMIRKMCTHLVWLEQGEVRETGLTEDVVLAYQEYANVRLGQQLAVDKQEGDFRRWGSRGIEITAVNLLDATGTLQNLFKTGQEMIVELHYLAHEPVKNPEFGLAIFRHDGTHLNGPNSRLAGLEPGVVSGAGIVRYRIKRVPFLPARYRITVAIHDSRVSKTYDYHEKAYPFRIVAGGTEEIHGLIEVDATWEWLKK